MAYGKNLAVKAVQPTALEPPGDHRVTGAELPELLSTDDAVLRRGLGVNVRCSEACTVRLEVVADDSGPGATLGHGATRLAAARSTTVTVTPTVVGRRRLRGAVPAVRVRAVARDAAGNPRTRLSRRVDIARR